MAPIRPFRQPPGFHAHKPKPEAVPGRGRLAGRPVFDLDDRVHVLGLDRQTIDADRLGALCRGVEFGAVVGRMGSLSNNRSGERNKKATRVRGPTWPFLWSSALAGASLAQLGSLSRCRCLFAGVKSASGCLLLLPVDEDGNLGVVMAPATINDEL